MLGGCKILTLVHTIMLEGCKILTLGQQDKIFTLGQDQDNGVPNSDI